ncbi:MAG: GTP-binding protein [Burkholderiaceae bacterium]|nr:GTP-binding protein [Burkholderiaceae bacterium]
MSKIPLTVLTGFLGSGKTTLLNGLLKHPELSDSAVLINEFGAVGLDHHLVETAREDTVVLEDGCVCCTVRGALAGALRALYWRRHDGKVPRFARVILETTGLARPAPLLHELLEHPTILQHYRLAGVVVCVDGVFGLAQIDHQPEVAQQVAVADRLLITKTELMRPAQLAALTARLRVINPGADMVLVAHGQAQGRVLDDSAAFDPLNKQLDVQHWLHAERYRRVDVQPASGLGRKPAPVQEPSRHGAAIEAFCLTFDQPLPWDDLLTALELILAMRGQQVLRLKGIVDVEGRSQPLVIHGVQRMLFPPGTLDTWPPGPRQTRLVFIVDGAVRDFISHTFDFFIHAKARARAEAAAVADATDATDSAAPNPPGVLT